MHRYVSAVESFAFYIDDDIDFKSLTPDEAGELLDDAVDNDVCIIDLDVLETELPHSGYTGTTFNANTYVDFTENS